MELYMKNKLNDITYLAELIPRSALKFSNPLEFHKVKFRGLSPGNSLNSSGENFKHLTSRD